MSASDAKRAAVDAATDELNAKRARSSSDSAAATTDASGGPFARLLPDIIGAACTYLPVTDLCSLRCVSHAWSEGSRSSHAWSTSEWRLDGWTLEESIDPDDQVDNTDKIAGLQASAPHLRSLIMSIDLNGSYSEGVDMAALGQAHPLLEHLALRRATAANLPDAEFKHLRHLTMSDGRVREFDADNDEGELTEEDVAAIGAQAGLVSLRLVCSIGQDQLPDVIGSLSTGTHVGSWVILQLIRYGGSIPAALDPTRVARFASLEDLTLQVTIEATPTRSAVLTHDNLRAFRALSSLRLLTIGEKVCNEGLAVLLSSGPSDAAAGTRPLARRLEHLALCNERNSIGQSSIALIAAECISLISLVVHGNFSMVFRPLTQDQWRERTELRDDRHPPAPLTFDEVQSAAVQKRIDARVASRASSAVELTPQLQRRMRTEDLVDRRKAACDFGLFLTAPVAFRRRLRFLYLWARESPKPEEARAMAAQAARCMPNLVLARFRAPGGQFNPADTPMRLPQGDTADSEWMTRETAIDPDDVTLTATPAGARLSKGETELLSYTPFHHLRAVKVAARLPLHPSEARQDLARPYPEPPEFQE